MKPAETDHDPHGVAAIRLAELRTAREHLGVADLELLGYHDSGMLDWDYKNRPDVFCNVPLETVAARVAGLIERHRPQVVVTYDPDGSYQHPDHVHAARAAILAVQDTNISAKLYLKAHGSSYPRLLRGALAGVGIERPSPTAELVAAWERTEQRITTTIDAEHVIERKQAALHAHASQLGSSMVAKLPAELFARVFSVEAFIRTHDTTGAPIPEHDLFAGL
ncbi:GlcNAc-PI de-N-acetylase [Longimycelium tulufanense]|uniref:GlcNAc-PI de-N-acetylase n=1 Tax=Longimycelium tulufanense TaxID=907463 RepID=A0A8J3CDV4_9PSEU|nr:GlcNAc-PI de-N-acetylase [Longimycelium tulufanense]